MMSPEEVAVHLANTDQAITLAQDFIRRRRQSNWRIRRWRPIHWPAP